MSTRQCWARRFGAAAIMTVLSAAVTAAPAAATVVKPLADGTLSVSAETFVSQGEDGASGLSITNQVSLPAGADDPDHIYLRAAQDGTTAPEPLHLDTSAADWCSDDLAGASGAIVCDAAQAKHITLDLGDGPDFVTTAPTCTGPSSCQGGLIRVGDFTADTSVKDAGYAVSADLGAGDDTMIGGPLNEDVRDGLGTDTVSLNGGADQITQPDTTTAAVSDHGDTLNPGSDAGDTVRYGDRGPGVGVTVETNLAHDDGAPGEEDEVESPGIVGTDANDVLTSGQNVFAHYALDGRGGDDVLRGSYGSDVLIGGPGADTFYSERYTDTGAGESDTIDAHDGQADAAVYCGFGADDTVLADDVDTTIQPVTTGSTLGCEHVTRFSTQPPDTTITKAPASPTSNTKPTLEFTASIDGATFECSVDAGAWTACTSPHTFGPLADGDHALRVRAVDASTGPDPTPASAAVTVDTTVPDTFITLKPTFAVHATAEFAWEANEPGASFQCRIDFGSFGACATPVDVAGLDLGNHTFTVRAFDAAGNVDPTPAIAGFSVANAAPTLAPVATPDHGAADLAVTFTLNAADADGDALTYDVDFGDGSAPAHGSGSSVAHIYARAGVFQAKLTVSDAYTSTTEPVTVTVQSPVPPGGGSGGGGGSSTTTTPPTTTTTTTTTPTATTPATAGAGAGPGQPTAPGSPTTPTPGSVSAGSIPTTPVYAAGTVTTRGTVKLAQLRAHGLKLSLTGLARGARATARLTLKLAGGKTRRLGTVRLKLTRAGRQKVTLRLPRSARLRLAPGRLQVSLRVTAPGTQPSSRTVVVQVRG